MKLKKSVLIMAALTMAAACTACGDKTVTYTTDDYINVTVSGVDGKGQLMISSCQDDFQNKVNEDLFDGEASEIDMASMLVNIAAYADYSVDGETGNLSNGDTVTITVTADNEQLKALGLQFAQDEYVYTVEGLEVPTELDVMSDVAVTFSGTEPHGEAAVEYTGSNDFIKNNVRYTADKSYSLSNGDTITVTASCSQDKLDENLYILNETEKSFTVEGLSYYATDLSGYDLSEIDDVLLENARAVMDKSTYMDAYKSNSRIYGSKIFADGNMSLEWKVNDEYDIVPCGKRLYSTDGENCYTVFYEVTVPLIKDRIDEWASKTDGYSEGDTYDLVLYVESHMSNIIITSDNELDTSSAKTGTTAYGNSLRGNYLGMSFEDILSRYEGNYSSWDVSEIE